mmetsp:Transcript_855/g.1068  ORF Transcript_855/g.1068 Transcript_855/m.1068 type:complete len:128 (+) Transcript_855:90-473(+)
MAALKLQFNSDSDLQNVKKDILRNISVGGENQLKSRSNRRRIINTQVSSRYMTVDVAHQPPTRDIDTIFENSVQQPSHQEQRQESLVRKDYCLSQCLPYSKGTRNNKMRKFNRANSKAARNSYYLNT